MTALIIIWSHITGQLTGSGILKDSKKVGLGSVAFYGNLYLTWQTIFEPVITYGVKSARQGEVFLKAQ